MDAGIAVKPVAGIAPTEHVRPTAVANQAAAPTDLPEAKTVSPPPEVTPTHMETPGVSSNAVDIAHNFIVDPQTREVVYRVMDLRTRQVLLQVPDAAALLRRAAYARALADNPKNAPTKNLTDIVG